MREKTTTNKVIEEQLCRKGYVPRDHSVQKPMVIALKI